MKGFGFFSALLIAQLLLSPLAGADDLQQFDNCRFIETAWADGDSFRVEFADGQIYTLRLYGADTLETRVNDSTLARRLRAQRRYFGISSYGNTPRDSIELAKRLGSAAQEKVAAMLAEPFTVHTGFADGRGSGQYKRIYAFVTTHDGRDLATELVRMGLARAYGVYRSAPDGQHRDEYRASLQDAELVAARRGVGIWEYTDWDALPEERREERIDEAEIAIAMGRAVLDGPVNLNQASAEELAALPSIGPVLAERIIAARPFQVVEDILKVPGIGPKTFEEISDQIEL